MFFGIVSTLVLRLKAAESFLESIQCTWEQQQRRSAEKSGLRRGQTFLSETIL